MTVWTTPFLNYWKQVEYYILALVSQSNFTLWFFVIIASKAEPSNIPSRQFTRFRFSSPSIGFFLDSLFVYFHCCFARKLPRSSSTFFTAVHLAWPHYPDGKEISELSCRSNANTPWVNLWIIELSETKQSERMSNIRKRTFRERLQMGSPIVSTSELLLIN